MSATYDFQRIEPEWQQRWESSGVFRAANPGQPGSERPPFYVLDFFPYPSGAGLHVGHPLGYIASDIVARFMRMRGRNVLHPMGWDAFGLPAEQYAIETGIHPAVTTRSNIATYTRQLRQIGLSYDWSRELATCDESYYHWTQWIFLRIFNSWYDPEHRWTDAAGRSVLGGARPIDELPIPADVRAQGESAIEDYRNEHRLAYLAEVPVNWCPALGTVLANEEVTNDGRSERGNHPVYRRPLRQWMLRITEYAERLLADLEPLDWPDAIKLAQRNWIGRSEGAYVDFPLADDPTNAIRVFTTRPDTLYGATFVVLAPEHTLASLVTTSECRESVDAYIQQARGKSELERTAETKIKTGVFTGAFAINPVNRTRVPIWIADYVLASYGTGSIMAVPGSDRRDLEFAEAFRLPVIQVVQPPGPEDWRGYEHPGTAVNSPPADAPSDGYCMLNGLATPDAKRRMIDWLEAQGVGEGTVQFKLRDWLFSRQRYWGEPFPILYRDDGGIVPESENHLPVRLPPMDDFRPQASSDPHAEPSTPLSRAADWAYVERDGRRLRRELNTMPQWAGSCWYYLRFIDPRNGSAAFDPAAERYWLGGAGADAKPKFGGVDLYLGGAEHAVLHLLYSRFWHKLLYDLRVVSTPEPFQKLFNQGMIGAPSYRDERGSYAPADAVSAGAEIEMLHPDEVDDTRLQALLRSGMAPEQARDEARVRLSTRFTFEGRPVMQTFDKMSKSKKNVVNPDDIIREYGADTLRLYEMYMGPLEQSKPWNTRDIIGVHRFLQRVWRLLIVEDAEAADGWRVNPRLGETGDESLERLLHKTIRKVTHDIERFACNTAIAQLIVWSNEAHKAPAISRAQAERFLKILSPFAPHAAEELWRRLGHGNLLAAESWPEWDEALTRDETVQLAVQILGKKRGEVTVPADADEAAIVAAALALPAVAAELSGKTLRRSIVVKGRLVNLVL